MAHSVPQQSRMRRLTLSLRGHVVYSPVDDFWISLPRSIRITVYNVAMQKIVIKKIVPHATFKQVALLMASEIFAVEAMSEFTLQYKSWTPSGNTVFSNVDLDQTVGTFHCVLDLQAVQVNPQGNDWKWFMSNMGYLQTRKEIQVAPASLVQMLELCGAGSYSILNSRDSAIFTMLNPDLRQALSRLFSVMTLPHHQSAAPGEILQITYTESGQILSTPCAPEVKVTIITKEGRRLLTTEVIGESKFEDLAVKICAQICGGLRVAQFTLKTASSTGLDFLWSDIVVGGFGAEVNIIAAEGRDEDRWHWRVCNAGHLEERIYYR